MLGAGLLLAAAVWAVWQHHTAATAATVAVFAVPASWAAFHAFGELRLWWEFHRPPVLDQPVRVVLVAAPTRLALEAAPPVHPGAFVVEGEVTR
jgi:hypothetical protein